MKTTLILLLGFLCGCEQQPPKPKTAEAACVIKGESLSDLVTKQELLEASVSDLELAKQELLELTIFEATNGIAPK